MGQKVPPLSPPLADTVSPLKDTEVGGIHTLYYSIQTFNSNIIVYQISSCSGFLTWNWGKPGAMFLDKK